MTPSISFGGSMQSVIQKIKEIEILPIYKFVLSDLPPNEFSKGLKEQFINEGFFEGVNVYQSYFNPELVSVLDYFEDYIIVYDEIVEIFEHLGFSLIAPSYVLSSITLTSNLIIV